MTKIFIYVIACNLRQLDAQKINRYLSLNNHQIVDNPKKADIILFVTCAFADEAVEISLNKVKEFQKYDAELIVVGCTPEIEKEKLAKIFDGKTISTKTLDEIDKLFPENRIKFNEMDDGNIPWKNVGKLSFWEAITKALGKTNWIIRLYLLFRNFILKNILDKNSQIYNILMKNYFQIRISRGCLSNCSYCAIKKAVGPLHSKSIDECIREFKKGLEKGYKDFLITADDSGAYGLDKGSTFSELLQKTIEIPGDYTISIKSINPKWVVKYIDDLEKIFKTNKIVDLGTPIQSGSSRILKLMNRYSDINKIKDAFNRLKKANPELTLDTHYILGFPTETEEEFKQSLELIREIDFDSGLILQFSCKTGTEAETMEPKVSKKEISKRMNYAKKFMKKLGYKIFYIKPRPKFLLNKRDDHFLFIKLNKK